MNRTLPEPFLIYSILVSGSLVLQNLHFPADAAAPRKATAASTNKSVLSTPAQPAVSSSYKLVSEIEQKVFGKTYANDLITERLERLEREVFQGPKSGPLKHRIDVLMVATEGATGPTPAPTPTPIPRPSEYQTPSVSRINNVGYIKLEDMRVFVSFGYGVSQSPWQRRKIESLLKTAWIVPANQQSPQNVEVSLGYDSQSQLKTPAIIRSSGYEKLNSSALSAVNSIRSQAVVGGTDMDYLVTFSLPSLNDIKVDEYCKARSSGAATFKKDPEIEKRLEVEWSTNHESKNFIDSLISEFKRLWKPPQGYVPCDLVVDVVFNSSGKLLKIELRNPSGVPELNQSFTQAVRTAANSVTFNNTLKAPSEFTVEVTGHYTGKSSEKRSSFRRF